jgi:hypothetical protein
VQMPLRSDYRIKTIESSAKHDEPKRIESSQLLKATGSSAGECCPPFRVRPSKVTHEEFAFPSLRHVHRDGADQVLHVVSPVVLWHAICLRGPT